MGLPAFDLFISVGGRVLFSLCRPVRRWKQRLRLAVYHWQIGIYWNLGIEAAFAFEFLRDLGLAMPIFPRQ